MWKNAIDGNRIVELRNKRGWNQQDLAREAGVTSSVISRFERNIQSDFKLSAVIAVAKALDVPLDSLLKSNMQWRQSPMTPALESAVKRLSAQPPEAQVQAAAILQGYLESLES